MQWWLSHELSNPMKLICNPKETLALEAICQPRPLPRILPGTVLFSFPFSVMKNSMLIEGGGASLASGDIFCGHNKGSAIRIALQKPICKVHRGNAGWASHTWTKLSLNCVCTLILPFVLQQCIHYVLHSERSLTWLAAYTEVLLAILFVPSASQDGLRSLFLPPRS